MDSVLNKKNLKKIVSDKRVQIGLTAVLFLIILISSMSIRLSGLDNLKDSTTGEYIPLALDPFYFLRMSETIAEGGLPKYDNMRAWALNTTWHSEIMPYVIVGMWKTASLFDSDITLRFVNVISPVLFYGLGLILFFFVIYILTKSKGVSLLGSAFLAYAPAYLYRTMRGFSDHEAIGMVGVFTAFLLMSLGLERFEKNWKTTILWGALLGFGTALTLATWGGAMTFVLMVIPLAFLLYHLLKKEDELKSLGYYFTWIVSSFLFSAMFGFPFSKLVNRFTSSYGLLVPFVFGFILIDYLLGNLKFIEKCKLYKKKFREAYSFGLTIIFGVAGLGIMGKNFFLLVKDIWIQLMHPFGLGRLGLTVAENSQPYLNDLINQTTKGLFWLFLIGVIYVGFEFSKGIKKLSHRLGFIGAWILLVSSILFSRISSSHMLNGENFVSQMFYMVGLIVFASYFIWIYFKRELKVETKTIFLFSLIILVLINGRSSVRSFFLIIPFICLIGAFGVIKTFSYARENNDDVFKLLLWVLLGILILTSAFTLYQTSQSVSIQAKYQSPSAGYQWQNAMSWVRENTGENDVFVHWWDYGYWVQTLGERPTVSDGGHAAGTGNKGDHYVGRYILTTDKPETAYSFMKTWNVSYLLIDPTELGKYAAYSRIGSDENWDRYSSIPTGVLDERQTQENSEGLTMVYGMNGIVDEDIYYEDNFLPGPTFDEYGRASFKSYIGAVILETIDSGDSMSLKQPKAVFVYNGQQIQVPLRYAYINGKLNDFKSGLDAGIVLLPRVQQKGVNPIGGMVYLSPKTFDSLYAQVYLMDDPFNEYGGIELVHEEDSRNVASIKKQGVDIGSTIFTNGFESSIRIYKINYPEDTPVHEEFYYDLPTLTHGELDGLF